MEWDGGKEMKILILRGEDEEIYKQFKSKKDFLKTMRWFDKRFPACCTHGLLKEASK